MSNKMNRGFPFQYRLQVELASIPAMFKEPFCIKCIGEANLKQLKK